MPHIWLSLVVATSLVLTGPLGAADTPAPKITYDQHVQPILREHCFACHGSDKQRGGLAVHNYSALMQGGSSGSVVKPGDPDDSRFYLLMAHKEKPEMPPKAPRLEQAKLDLVRQWIAAGALENTGSKAIAAKPKTEVALSSIVRGRPSVPPMPARPLPLEPVLKTAKANAVIALASSPWAPLIAVGGQKQVLLYNSDTLDLAGVLPFAEGVPHVLRFSRNGSLLLAGGGREGKSGKVVVWNVATGQRVIELGDETDAVLAADISADQSQVALGGPSKIVRVYSTRDGALLREIKKHTDWITALEYSPDGVLLATADRAGNMLVWEAFTGREYFSLRGHTAAIQGMSWRMDSNVLASISEDATLRLWEMENGNAIKSWAAHGGGSQAVQFTHDHRLVSCGRDRTAKTWDQNGAQQRAFGPLADVAIRCCFSHDGNRVIAGDWTGVVRVWDAKDGRAIGDLPPNPVGSAERLDLARKDLVAKQTTHDQTQTSLKATEVALQQVTTELAAAQKTQQEAATAAKTAQESEAKAKPIAIAEQAKQKSAQDAAAAREVVARAYAEAATKVKAAADAAKTNAALTEAAAKAKATADGAAGELAAAQKALAETTASAKAATDAHAKATQALAAAQATLAQATKNLEGAQARLKTAQTQLAAQRSAADLAGLSLSEAKDRVKRLEATQRVVQAAER